MKRKWSRISLPHRRLLISSHFKAPQRGADVRELQKSINRRAAARGISGIVVDGACGRHTVAKGRQIAKALGIGLRGPGLSPYVQNLIRHPKLRTPAQRDRGKRWVKRHQELGRAKVSGNKVKGGTKRQRLAAGAEEAAALYASGQAHRFYSQPGKWTVEYGITGEPAGYRSDCSQFVTSIYHSAGLPDPNGTDYTGGYTGTLATHCTYIERGDLAPGDLVLYGPAPHHHVEMYVGPGDRTIGHGSPPVDEGDIDMIADPHFARAL